MRIIQLSDIHLHSGNLENLQNYYLDALINDLVEVSRQNEIDVILITGDLVDKGGASLGENPYEIFENQFIAPLIEKTGVPKERVFFIPGNHDINKEAIEEDSEYVLVGRMNSDFANERAREFHDKFNNDNKRIEKFKNFESRFHKSTENYSFSNNESTVILQDTDYKIGIALFNDSWRCSPQLKKEHHFMGTNQLHRAANKFEKSNTVMNIGVFHHPLEAFNEEERRELINILKAKEFNIAVFGHNHRHKAERSISAHGSYLSINSRSAFSNSREMSSIFQPGYNIIEVNPKEKAYKIYARKFIQASGYRFDSDTDSLPNGEESGRLLGNERLVGLAQDTNNQDSDLPDSYSADVDRIVSLLIGESIYSDKYAFVRELVQNSVDACIRIKDKHSYLNPKIVVNIDDEANYVEVSDEGDGMTKNIIKNHFAVIGKSISQDYNDNTYGTNLISKFGIGFISTFIAGEKVVVRTKSEKDGLVVFEIDDVFSGFKYLPTKEGDFKSKTGTSVRVYLKRNYSTELALKRIQTYCRHIENLEINRSAGFIRIDEKWNMEDSLYTHCSKNPHFEIRLGLNINPNKIIASYCGFLVNGHSYNILPHNFPSHIVGEINFSPKSIDFDVSRSTIIPSKKSDAVREEISLSLRQLFRDALENKNLQIYPLVVVYLQFYLQDYQVNQSQYVHSYKDFYSNYELLALCSEHTIVDYDDDKFSIGEVITVLKRKSINKIYVVNPNQTDDITEIIIQYLESKGNLILKKSSFAVNFHGVQQRAISFISSIRIIAEYQNITIQEVENIAPEDLTDMTLDKTQFPSIIQLYISQIENEYGLEVHVGKFGQNVYYN